MDGDYVYFRNYRLAPEDTKSPDRFQGTNELLIVGETSPDSPFYPLPDHVPALGDMAGDEAAQLYQLQFFRNNAVPRIAVVVENGRLDEDTKAYLLSYMREGIRGDAHKTLILQGTQGTDTRIRIERLTVGTREEADFMAYRKFVVGQVIMAHRVSPSKVTIVENANLANSKDQDKTFKEQVIKPDQERWERRIQWLLEDEFGPDLPIRFRFREMDLADEEQIARTRSFYMGALTNNEVRSFLGMGDAGRDPDTGAVTDPDLAAWGEQPFEAPPPPPGGAQEGLGNLEPMSKRISPVHRAFVAEVAKLGYLVEEIRELAGPDPEHEAY
ncbi:MAG: phage portal protein [Actinobacteria bacterium]|nr:phage portal protein [Actinomycetota bacterium]